MTIAITVRFIGGQTFSGLSDGSKPEWPPRPSRLFQALVAGSAGACGGHEQRLPSHQQALEAVESSPAPRIACARSLSRTVAHEVFGKGQHVPVEPGVRPSAGDVGKLTGVTMYPGYPLETGKNTLRLPRGQVGYPSDTEVIYYLDVAHDHRTALDDMAGHIPYLGKATDLASVTVSVVDEATVAATATTGGKVLWVPITDTGRQTRRHVSSRYWAPGLMRRLDARYEAETTASAVRVSHPTEAMPEVMYLVHAEPGHNFSVRLPRSVTGRQMQQVVEHLGESQLYPWWSERARRVLGVVSTGSTHDVTQRYNDVVDTVLSLPGQASILDEGDTVEFGPQPWIENVTGSSTRWSTALPVLSMAHPALAQAEITVLLAQAMKVDSSELDVSIIRAADKPDGAQLYPPADGTQRLWHVDVRSQQIVTGPVQIGAYGGTFLPVT